MFQKNTSLLIIFIIVQRNKFLKVFCCHLTGNALSSLQTKKDEIHAKDPLRFSQLLSLKFRRETIQMHRMWRKVHETNVPGQTYW